MYVLVKTSYMPGPLGLGTKRSQVVVPTVVITCASEDGGAGIDVTVVVIEGKSKLGVPGLKYTSVKVPYTSQSDPSSLQMV